MSSDQEKETKALMNFLLGRKFYTILRQTGLFQDFQSLHKQASRLVVGIEKEGVNTKLHSIVISHGE